MSDAGIEGGRSAAVPVAGSPERCSACGEMSLVFFVRKNIHRCTNPLCGEEAAPADTRPKPSPASLVGERPPDAHGSSPGSGSQTVVKLSIDASVPPAVPDALSVEAIADQPWSVWQDFGPFLQSLSHCASLLSGLDKLAKETRPEAALTAISEIFVDVLGYRAVNLDETTRLGGRAEFKRLQLVAEHQGFTICFVELTGRNSFARFYEAIYRFHSTCLIISVEPSCRSIRFVYRLPGAPGGMYRTLTGPLAVREPSDNLAVWCRRLTLLRPRLEDDEMSLADRCQRALSAPPEELSGAWESAPLPAQGTLPGVPWGQSVSRGFRSFLQLGVPPEERLHWGLQALLRNGFPIALARATATLECRGYRIGERTRSNDEAEATGRSSTREIELDLTLRAADIETFFTLPCALLEPDGDGVIVIDGLRHRISLHFREGNARSRSPGADEPVVDEADLLDLDTEEVDLADAEVDEDDLREDEDASEDDDFDKPVKAPPDDDRVGTPAPGALLEPNRADEAAEDETVSETTWRTTAFRGALGDALFTFAVGRRLAGLAYMLFRRSPPLVRSPSVLLATLQTLGDERGRILLAASSGLHPSLVAIGRRPEPATVLPTLTLDDVVGGPPPAWACPEASSDLPPGVVLPIAGARVGPTGAFYIPRSDGPGRVRLTVATGTSIEVNPRVTGAPLGPPQWWIAAGLGAWAHLPPGRIRNPAMLVAFAHPVRAASCAIVRWRDPHAWLSHTLGRRLPPRRDCLARRMAEGPWSATPPRLLVSVGDIVKPGDPWLEIPHDLNPGHNVIPRAPYVELSRGILEYGSIAGAEPSCRREHVPPAQHGRVTEARLTLTRKPGWITGSWFAFVRIEHPTGIAGNLTLASGATISIVGTLEEADAPYTTDGDPVEMLIGQPEPPVTDQLALFDGQTGELLSAYPLSTDAVWTPLPPCDVEAGADPHLRRRLYDGEGIPSGPYAAALSTADRLLWNVLEPDSYAVVTRIERDASAGMPPWLPRMIEALSAADIAVPALGPAPIAGSSNGCPRIVLSKMPSPSVRWSQLHSNYHADGPHLPLVRWIDNRGRQSSIARAYDPSGESTVQPRPVSPTEVPVVHFTLAIPVVHPWRLLVVAGLLGLTRGELDHLLARFGPVDLRLEVEAAVSSPERAAQRRLAIETDPVRRQGVEACASILQHEMAAPGLGARLWLDALPVPPPPLWPNGLPPGATDTIGSPLNRSYARVANANTRVIALAATGSREIMRSAHAMLQHAVTQVFGDPDARPETDELSTLAAWVRRLWPLTRPADLASSVVGLTRVAEHPRLPPPCAPMLPEALEDPTLLPVDLAAMPAPAAPELAGSMLVIADHAATVQFRRPASSPRRESDPAWWIERHATHRLLRAHLPALIAIFAALDLPGPAWPRGCLSPDALDLAAEPHAGSVLLRALAEAITTPGANPAGLCALLEASLPRRLANDPHRALASLEATIERALPGANRGADLVRTVLGRLLAGFWQLETLAGTSRWVWLPLEAPRPSGGQRYVPPLRSAAWRLWPGFDACTSPVRYLMSLATPLPSAMAVAVGIEAPIPESIVWEALTFDAATEPATTGEQEHEHEPPPAAEPTPASVAAQDGAPPSNFAPEIEIMVSTLRVWLYRAPEETS